MTVTINGTSGITYPDTSLQAKAGLVTGGSIATGTITTLTTSTISDGTNSASATNTIRGSAKAWVAFNDASTVLSSYNVSSITNLGASGNFSRFQVNFTNAMSDTNYCALTTGSTTSTPYAMHINQSYATPSTTNVVLLCTVYNASGAYVPSLMNVAVFR